MGSVATVADEKEFCTYSPTKLDSQVLPLAKAAAALKGLTVQEWLSEMANVLASRELGRKPIKRRLPRPRTPPSH